MSGRRVRTWSGTVGLWLSTAVLVLTSVGAVLPSSRASAATMATASYTNFQALDKVTGYNVVQSSVSDGQYVYVGYMKDTRYTQEDDTIIVKYDLSGKQLGHYSFKGADSLGHMDSMTYNSKTKQIVAIWGAKNRASFVDVATMKIVARKSLKATNFLCYDAQDARYANADPSNIYVYDGNLGNPKKVASISAKNESADYVQGGTCDPDYLYLYISRGDGKTKARVLKYDWAGN